MNAFPDKEDLNVYIYWKSVYNVVNEYYYKVYTFGPSTILYGHRATNFYIPFQSRTMFNLWKAYETRIFDIQTNKLIRKPRMSISETQTTMTISISPIYDFLEYEYDGKPLEKAVDGKPLEKAVITYTGLLPNEWYPHSLKVKYLQDFYYDDGREYQNGYNFRTEKLGPTIRCNPSPSSLRLTTSYQKGDAIITGTKFVVNNKVIPESESQDGEYEVYYTGLDPQQSINAVYEITVSYGENNELSRTYEEVIKAYTLALTLTPLSPKVTNKGEAVVSAKTNLDEIETHVGFEWRKTDAPDVVESKWNEAIISNGTIEGKIKNLDASSYWKVRAYYKSDSGKMYYGDWIGFDPSDFSYFEPTVHTYGSPTVDGPSVTLLGTVVEGTDEIQEQGFEYWKGSASSARANRTPSNAQRIKASGQRMTATVTGLSNGTYTYCSYVKTAKGTFYGEEQTFSITEGSNAEGGDNETKTYTITTSKAGYATFYDSQTSYTLPTGLTAQVVTAVTNDKLAYETIGSSVPKGVAVVLKGSTKAVANYDLTSTATATSYSGTNLLHGSDAATTTTGDGYHYKLSYGRSGSTLNNVFGWYWGTQNGGSFQIDAHKAWLVLPKSAGTRSFYLDGESTGILTVNHEEWSNDNWHDLQGRRISKPTAKGVYLNNGKKVMVK